MDTSLIVGLTLITIFLVVIIKLLLGLKSESRFLTYEFPTGWEKKIRSRYPLYESLNEEQAKRFKKKVQIIIAKRKFVGLESLSINIDLRLAIASEMALLTLNQKVLNPYSKLSPIAILPIEKYEEFKNRSTYTLYWDQEKISLYLEAPNNRLLKSSYYLFLKVDKRLKQVEDDTLEVISNKLSQSTFPSEQESNSIFSISKS